MAIIKNVIITNVLLTLSHKILSYPTYEKEKKKRRSSERDIEKEKE